MLILDFETTGLYENAVAHETLQPYVIDIGLLKVKDGKIIDTFETLVKPPIAIEPDLAKNVHGIYDEHVEKEQPFSHYIERLKDMFVGETIIAGHNVIFDVEFLYYELLRCGEHIKFPFCRYLLDTQTIVEQELGKGLSLSDAYERITGTKPDASHRALVDCKSCYEILEVFGKL